MNNRSELAGENNSKSSSSRRKVLSGITAGIAITSLRSKTAWAGSVGGASGSSVSGNLSGNLSNAFDSDVSTVVGKSPGYWSNVLNKRNHNKYDASANVAWGTVFGVTRAPFNGIGNSYSNIGDFIPHGKYNNRSHNEINRHLVAAYMNAKTGLYPLATGVTPEAYVIGLYDLVSNGTYSQEEISESIYSTYD